jgi:peptide chain release factor subunit 3
MILWIKLTAQQEHLNTNFLIYVHAGKSILRGSILYASGTVNEYTMEKYERKEKEAGRKPSSIS